MQVKSWNIELTCHPGQELSKFIYLISNHFTFHCPLACATWCAFPLHRSSHITKAYKVNERASQIRFAIVIFRQHHHETEAINHHSLSEENSHFTLILTNSWSLMPVTVDGQSIKLLAYCKILQPRTSRNGYPALLSDSIKFQLLCHVLPYSMLFSINFLVWNV